MTAASRASGGLTSTDRGTEAPSPTLSAEATAAGARVLDVATFAGDPVALVTVPTGEAAAELRLAEANGAAADDLAYELSPVGAGADASGYRLLTTAGALHALPDHAADGAVLLSWSAATAHQAWAGEPRSIEVAGAWQAVTAWEHGLVLATENGLRLLVHDGDAWWETQALATGGPVWSMATRGDLLYVALPGEVRAYDLADPVAPRLLGRLGGSSHTTLGVLPDGGVALGSPGFAAPWVELDAADFTAPSAGGFRPAPDFLPRFGER